MLLKDTRNGYGLFSILLHWIVAAFIVFQFVSGKVFESLGRTPQAREVRMIHIAVGAIALVFIFARVAWRYYQGSPEKIGGETLLNKLAQWVQWLLVAGMIALVITGFGAHWSGGRAIEIFGLLSLPSPMARNEALHEIIGETHAIIAHLVMALVVIHAAGAFKHLLVDRDGVMRRMVRPVSEG